MTLNLSPSELGIIVSALQNEYQSGSDESSLAQSLCECVYDHFNELNMPNLYDEWVNEYDIIE